MTGHPALPPDRLRELAAMARLELDPERAASLRARLGDVLAAFAALRTVETGDLAEADETPPLRLRADEPGPVLEQITVLANSSRTAAGCFLVPRVVDA